jgi:predicted signal transduction protein with EAL and GGDEF domain
MISAMQLPFEIHGHTLYVGTSIGAAVFPHHGETEVKLLAHADTAMYRAKETGKARCVVYSQEKFTQPEHDVSMEAAMFQAVRNGEFLLHYQPIVDARSRQIMGFEALMRWGRPGEGMVSPAQFIPMAENNGLINLLGLEGRVRANQALRGSGGAVALRIGQRQSAPVPQRPVP